MGTDFKTIGSSLNRSPAGLPPMPERVTLRDIFELRLGGMKNMPFNPAKHMIQSATNALDRGMDEETVLGCLLHDVGHAVNRADHGWWGAQLVEPYVSERVSWAIRYHQALRYYPDPSVGYEYPELYLHIFGEGYEPPDYIRAAYEKARAHPWYMTARMITVFDNYSFDPLAEVSFDRFVEIVGRHFKQPAEGLGCDDSAVAHMWRTIIDPNKPL